MTQEQVERLAKAASNLSERRDWRTILHMGPV